MRDVSVRADEAAGDRVRMKLAAKVRVRLGRGHGQALMVCGAKEQVIARRRVLDGAVAAFMWPAKRSRRLAGPSLTRDTAAGC